jgi:hypothetical protein
MGSATLGDPSPSSAVVLLVARVPGDGQSVPPVAVGDDVVGGAEELGLDVNGGITGVVELEGVGACVDVGDAEPDADRQTSRPMPVELVVGDWANAGTTSTADARLRTINKIRRNSFNRAGLMRPPRHHLTNTF